MLPAAIAGDLKLHINCVRSLHDQDLARGFGRAPLPYALARKYKNVYTHLTAKAEDLGAAAINRIMSDL